MDQVILVNKVSLVVLESLVILAVRVPLVFAVHKVLQVPMGPRETRYCNMKKLYGT